MQKPIQTPDLPSGRINAFFSHHQGMIDPGDEKPDDIYSVVNYKGNAAHNLSLMPEQFALALCLHGTVVRSVNQIQFDVNPGTIHLVLPHSLILYQQASADLELLIIYFKKELLNDNIIRETMIEHLLIPDSDLAPAWTIQQNRIADVLALYNKLFAEYTHIQPYRNEMMRLLFIELLLESTRAIENGHERTGRHLNRSQQIAQKFKKLVGTHFLSLRAVQDYADKLFITPKHLSEVIRRETGQTPLHILHNRIFEEAQYLIRSSDLHMKEIADRLNFDTSAHFSRFFKTFSGQNPTDFQRLTTAGRRQQNLQSM